MNSENFKEKAYFFRDESEDEEITEQLKLFFEELINRKDSNGEDGLQAIFVLLTDSFGGKVCEKNGMAPYDHSIINLVKFLNDQKDYLSVDESFDYSLRKDAMEEVDNKGIRGRIVSGKNSFTLAITGCKYSTLVKFQRDSLQKIIALCEEIRNKRVYSEVKVGMRLYWEGVGIECDSLTDSQLEKLKESLCIDKK